MPFISGDSGGGGGGSGTVTSVALSDGSSSTTAITTSGTFTLAGAGGISTSASGFTVTISNSGADTLVTKSANYTLTTSDKFVLVDHSGTTADITLTMPASTSAGASWTIIDTGYAGTYKTVIDGNGNNINQGANYQLIGSSAAVSIVSNGTDFFVF